MAARHKAVASVYVANDNYDTDQNIGHSIPRNLAICRCLISTRHRANMRRRSFLRNKYDLRERYSLTLMLTIVTSKITLSLIS